MGTNTQRGSGIAACALLALLTLFFLVHTVIPASGRLTFGFMAYFVAGQSVRDHEPGTRLYDDRWFAEQVRKDSGGSVSDVYLANPPALAVAWTPFASLTVEAARRVWVSLSVLCLAISMWLICLELRWTDKPWALAGMTAVFTLAAPTREQFAYGQIYVVLLLVHVLGWRAYVRHRDARAGVALGLAMALKVSGWPIGLLLLAQRRWIAVGAALATGVAVCLLSLPWVGLDAWRAFALEAIPRTLAWGAASLTAYQDTTSFWQHLFRYVPTLNPAPLVDAPRLATALTLATTLGACFALVTCRRATSVRFVAALALSELLSPVAEQYHYVLLLLPLAVLWQQVAESRDRLLALLALAATVLIAVPINYKAPHPTWSILVNYPRLIGGWLVFAALLFADRRAPPVPTRH